MIVTVKIFLLMIPILFKDYDTVRAIIVWIDPKMTNYTIDSEKDYGVDCWDITWDRLYSHLDWFAFGHYWGWGMKVRILDNDGNCFCND